MGFGSLDYLVLILYLLCSVALGTVLGRGQRSLEDYFLGARRMPWWAISLSIVATETSTLTFIGAPALAYTGDLTFLQVVIGYLLGRVAVSFLLIPAYFQGRLDTAYQLLQMRISGRVRSLSAVIFQLTRLLADGVRLFATALVLSVVTGLSELWTIAIIGAVTLLYTFFGGMKAVVWNDVIQLLIYLLGAALAFAIILGRVPGGWTEVLSTATAAEKLRLFDFSWDFTRAYTFWAGLLGGSFLTLASHGTDQMMVQRYLACGQVRTSQRALIVSGLVVFAQFALFLFMGVMLFVFYQRFPLPTPLEQADRIFPLFVVREMPSGIRGIILAAIFAAAMSTLSSSLNSLASSSMNDLYRRFVPQRSEGHYLWISRALTLFWGVLLMGVSLLARDWGGLLEAGLTIASITTGSILGIFLLTLAGQTLSEAAALTGMSAGVAAVLLTHLGTPVAWTWYVLIGTGVTLAVGRLTAWAAGE